MSEVMSDHDLTTVKLDSLDVLTLRKATDVQDRAGYRVTGFVLTHHALPKTCIVNFSKVRWFLNHADFMRVMNGKEPIEPEVAEEGFMVEMPEAAPAPLAAVTVAKPSIAAPATRAMIESVEEAIGELAKGLGCHHNTMIPHNSGWFVPGKANAYASAFDAVTGLFASLSAGGTVHKPAAAPAPVEKPPAPEAVQGGLF